VIIETKRILKMTIGLIKETIPEKKIWNLKR